jgi:hypothetical protein
MIRTASHRLNDDMFCGLSSGSMMTRCGSPSTFCEADTSVSVVAVSWGWPNDPDILVNVDMVRHKPNDSQDFKERWMNVSRCEADGSD